jgi:hypothetical protein
MLGGLPSVSSSSSASSRGEQSGSLTGDRGGSRTGFVNNFAAAGARLESSVGEADNPFGRMGNYVLFLMVGIIGYLAFRKFRS